MTAAAADEGTTGRLDKVVAALLSHGAQAENRKWFGKPNDQGEFGTPADQLTRASLQEICRQLAPDQVLAIESPCLLEDNSTGHIPLIDFRCKPHSQRLRVIKSALRQMGQDRGVLLESGRSYHYYGFGVLRGDSWIELIGRCALFPYVDARYLGHRMLSRRFCLRISAANQKPTEPRVVDWL